MRLFDKSRKLDNVCYDIRGPVMDEAARMEANGMEIENEEAVVDMFAKGIYQILQDNGARLFDISKGGEG